MGLFFDYTDSDKVNHIRLIIMAYENDATLRIDYPPKNVGHYYILYESTLNGKTKMYLESVPTENALKRWTPPSFQKDEKIEIIAQGLFFTSDNAQEILKPLFLKIRELEEEIKLLKNPSSTLGPTR